MSQRRVERKQLSRQPTADREPQHVRDFVGDILLWATYAPALSDAGVSFAPPPDALAECSAVEKALDEFERFRERANDRLREEPLRVRKRRCRPWWAR